MRWNALFNAPPVDEVALFHQAAEVSITGGQDELRSLHLKDGISLATAALYKHLVSKHHEFISTVEQVTVSGALDEKLKPTKLLIIPGMFYKEHKEVGADGSLLMSIARQLGFSAELVGLKSRGSVSENVMILKNAIMRETHPRLWLVSFSKGSIETRMCLEQLGGENKMPPNIRGWISISGMMRGSPLADMKLRSSITRTIWYLVTLVLGIDYAFTKEVATIPTSSAAQRPFELEMVHVTGIPLPSHVSTPLRKKYALLEERGPNDGIVLLEDFLMLPGHVYPIWGTDHLLRTNNMSTIIYKLCNYINNQ